MSDTSKRIQSARGVTLIETLIGLALIAALALTMASLLAFGRGVMQSTRRHTIALWLARARLEQLRGLVFGRQSLPLGGVVDMTDLTTALSGREPRLGGPGLGVSPEDTLIASRAGWVDYLDAQGRWVGEDEGSARLSAFVRRWQVRRLGGGASEVASFEVLVAPSAMAARASPADLLTHPDVVRLVGARARRAG
jgi:type II secretory pathway pseudopilin PulG